MPQKPWDHDLEPRMKQEIEFARVYARDFKHGTSGHWGYLTLAAVADLLDQQEVDNIKAELGEPVRQ